MSSKPPQDRLITTAEEVATNFIPTEARLESVEKAALSVGIVLAVMSLIGLTLNYTPLGIRFFLSSRITCAFNSGLCNGSDN